MNHFFFTLFLILILNPFLLKANDNVTLQLSWFNQFQFAGYYIAKEKGFYKDEGLDVNIKPFEFGLDIPQGVSDGKYDFAVGRETLILEKTNNKNIVTLYALFQNSPLLLISTKESNINSITDFNGKRIMTTIDDASEVSLKSMIISQKVQLKNLKFINHTHNINDLINKKTDVISAYTSKAPYFLQKMGVDYNTFSPSNYGFDMYSDFLYTSKTKLENQKELVEKFRNASLKGWEYAYSNIEEAVDLILEKYNTQNLTREELIFEGKELKKLSFYDTEILGNIDLSKLQRIYDLYNVMGLVKNNIDVKDFVYINNSLINHLKNEFKRLSEYKELPYLYFFIGLFSLLIIVIIYKNIVLYKVTHKLKNNEEKLLEMNKELKDLSEKDFLTKIYNRRYFETISKESISLAKRENKDVAILLIDLDNFKKINDTYGHQVGDYVLCAVADLMMDHKRKSDVVCRYGGEEFAILLPNTSLSGAKKYSENLREVIANEKLKIDNLSIRVTASMGLTICKPSDDIYSALDRADEGMYIAKKNGKNQLNIFN